MKKIWKWLFSILVLAIAVGGCAGYVLQYYHADKTALTALQSDENVAVSQTDYGWLFDGPSDTDAIIFYPGGKVEETAYAPLLRQLAENGMDAFLVKMPCRLAVLNQNKADKIFPQYDYANLYIGGHSLGGVCAANYASAHSKQFKGVILLAAYPTKQLPDTLKTVYIYGSEDGVLNMEKLELSKQYAKDADTYIISGGNHAQFGSYGNQKGDGTAAILAQEQINIAVQDIFKSIGLEISSQAA